MWHLKEELDWSLQHISLILLYLEDYCKRYGNFFIVNLLFKESHHFFPVDCIATKLEELQNLEELQYIQKYQ